MAVPELLSSFHPLEKVLLAKFIPALTDLDYPGALQPSSLLALPTRLGGLSIVAPDFLAPLEFSASLFVTAPLLSLILSRNFNYGAEVRCSQFSCKLEIKQTKLSRLSTLSKELSQLTTKLQTAVSLAQPRPQAGSQLCQCKNMAFPYTGQPLEMLLVYGMVSFPPIYILTAHVVQPFLLIMFCLVQREDFHQFAIMRLGI